MASPSPAERKRPFKRPRPAKQHRPSSKYEEGAWAVEKVIDHKLVKHEPRFLIRWKGYGEEDDTWEPMDDIVKCEEFKKFINNKFKSFETDILVNTCNLQIRLGKKIRMAEKQKKAITMSKIEPFDPFEFKIKQVFFHLVPHDEIFLQDLKDQVFKSHFFKLDEAQRRKNGELLERIFKKEDVKVTIENDEDFEDPPQFEYITKNFLTDEMYVIDHNNIRGCKCTTCTKDSDCCPKLKNEPFAYKVNRHDQPVLRLRPTRADKIIECGDLCSCGSECLNRATQQRKETPLCLFKTVDLGWGIRTLDDIPKGKFILEYVGELIGQAEANSREEISYLLDLKSDRKDSHVYTIDAFKFGNLSRFVNHSCKPNARIWFVNNCHGDPKNQKLCFFADRKIAKGEEVTIDYSGARADGRDPHYADPIPCNCGAESCRKFIY